MLQTTGPFIPAGTDALPMVTQGTEMLAITFMPSLAASILEIDTAYKYTMNAERRVYLSRCSGATAACIEGR